MVMSTKRKCIYVAGAISASSAGKFLNNIRKGIQLSKDVFLAGYAPFCPFIDFHYNLVMTDAEVKSITTEDYYDYSIAWLEKTDAVLLVPGWGESVGTLKEIARAQELNIPIYHTMAELLLADVKK
jgi:hypothetical protein